MFTKNISQIIKPDGTYTLDGYKPRPEWYAKHPWGIHGMGHAARVLVWVDKIGRWMLERGYNLDLEVVRWAAVLHDVRRVKDGGDLWHGERAAIWLKDNSLEIPYAFSPEQLVSTCYCCQWHVPHDHHIPEMTKELMCLKDADGLDRVRLGDLKLDYLRMPYSKLLARPAKTLYDLSQSRQIDEWEAVREAALELELWH